jgi:hypothetical protein
MRRTLILASLLLVTLPLAAQSGSPVELEIGWRFTDIEGSEDVYRTQINEDDGLLIRSLRYSSSSLGIGDHLRIDATDLGAGPAGALRLEAGQSEQWHLRVTYRDADAFLAHPGLARGQHRWDRTRTFFEADLEVLSFSAIKPFVGVGFSTYEGPGQTTYSIGGDDFVLDSDLTEKEREIRAGFGFEKGRFAGVITQGWRQVESDESMTLTAGGGTGNNPGTILGRPITAGGISRDSTFDSTTPFTSAYLTAQALPRLLLIGDFSYASAEGDGPELETATGNFVSFGLGRAFLGLTDEVASRAETRLWRAGVRGEYSLTDSAYVTAAWRRNDRDMNGAAAFHAIFRDTINFSGADPIAALEEIFEAESAMERTEDQLELSVSARNLGPFSIRAGYTRTQEDVSLSPAAEEIVLSGPEQGGDRDRSIDTLEIVGAFGMNGFNASLASRRDQADHSILRTDYDSRDRTRARASYLFRRFIRVGAMAESIRYENDDEGVGFENDIRQYGADLEVMLRDRAAIRAAWSSIDVDGQALILRPENFAVDRWTYAEDGEALEAGFTLFYSPFTLDASYSQYENRGSNDFDLDRYRLRAVYDFSARVGVAAEWSSDRYDEELFPQAGFDASRYGLFLRLRR